VRLSIAWKIVVAFCLVVLVVLGLGLWSLQATRRLHDLNQTLLTEAIPAVRLQLSLGELIHTLVRHETRALVLRDPAYQTLHGEGAQEFQSRLERVSGFLKGRETQAALGQVRARFAEYLALVEEEWRALRRGRPNEALRLSERSTREASDALGASLETLLAQSQAELARNVETAGGLERSARTAILLSLALSLAVGLALAGLVAFRIARPIRALSRATQLVARGEYDLPIMVKSRDEVGDLARAFREMAQKLREVETVKQEFFANISHELRSPLNSIGAAASLLRATPLSPNQERWLEIIRLDSEKLLRLTKQILDLSKLRSGMLRLDVAQADLRQIVESAAQELLPETDQKGVTLTVTLPEPSPRLMCDEHRMQQVLANLLSNAVRFTPKGGRVNLTGREEEEELIITVEDTGVGIPGAQLPRIFDRYQQAHLGEGGTGLGLAIVKGLVEAHGGRVWAESQEREGSRFHLALPRQGSSGG